MGDGEVIEGVLADEAADLMAGYLCRSQAKRPEVTLKLAVKGFGEQCSDRTVIWNS